ncbi:MAG TPA: hypothetical protein EYG21_03880 [Nitrospinaceae bacterium]|nr:hypothetical protein [Nitrospinaceae bacterium]
MRLSKIISDAVDDASYKTTNGMIDLSDPYHYYLVAESLKEFLDPDMIEAALFGEKEDDADKSFPAVKLSSGNVSSFDTDDARKNAIDNGTHAEVGSADAKKAQAKAGGNGKEPAKKEKPETPEAEPESSYPKPGEKYKTKRGDEIKMPPMTGNNSSQKEIETKVAIARKKIDKIKDPDNKKAAEEAMNLLEEYGNAKTYEEKIKVLKKMQASGLIKRNNRGSGTKKIYILVGGVYYKEFGKNSALHREIAVLDEMQFDKDGNGLLDTKEEGKQYGKKAMAPKNLTTNEPRGVKVTKNKDESVTIDGPPGGTTISKLPDPDDPKVKAKLRDAYTVDGVFNQEEHDKARLAMKRHNRLVEEVEKVIASGGGELPCIDPLPGPPPTDPSTEAGRQDLMNATGEAIALRFETLGGENLSDSQKKIIQKFRALRRPPLTELEYEEKLLDLADDMQNDIDFNSGYADIVETLSYMRHLNRGSVAYLPSAGNFPLGDVLTFPNNESQPDFEKDTPEQIASKMKAVSLSVDNRSIKKGVGGASSTHTKVALTDMVDMDVNGKTIEAADVKEDQEYLSDKGYDEIFGVRGNQNAVPPVKAHISTPQEVQAAHDKVGVLAQKYDVNITSDEYLEKRKERIYGKHGSIGKVIADRKKAGKPDFSKDELELLKKKHEAYYDLGYVQADVYNRQLKLGAVQLYTNEVWKTDENGRTTTSETNGIDCLAFLKFEFASGWLVSGKPGNKVPSRFNNKNKEGESCG